MQVVATYPSNSSSPIYLDDAIVVRFDEPVEGSYLTDAYFLLYRTDSTYQVYYSQVQKTIQLSNLEVRIKPSTLNPDSHYSLIIVGGNSGIRSISGSTLSGNVIVNILTGKGLSPAAPTITTVSGEVITNIIDGATLPDSMLDSLRPSTDVFVSPSESLYSLILTTLPGDKAIGVSPFDTISIVCNGTVVEGCLPSGAVQVSYAALPIDSDPMSDKNLPFTITYHDNVVALEFGQLIETTNREFLVTVSPGFLMVDGKQRDMNGYSFRFLGTLSPLYATPSYIENKLAMYMGTTSLVSTYDLVKLILEKSQLLQIMLGSIQPSMLPIVADYITCLILRDFVLYRFALSGRLRARELLATRVEYDNAKLSDIKGLIDDCINEASSQLGISDDVSTTIKSRVWMNRETKQYGIYR